MNETMFNREELYVIQSALALRANRAYNKIDPINNSDVENGIHFGVYEQSKELFVKVKNKLQDNEPLFLQIRGVS